MKISPKIIALFALVLAIWQIQSAQSQAPTRTIEKSFQNIEKIEGKIGMADQITIKSWAKNEVWIKASIQLNNGEKNDVVSFELTQEGTTLRVSSEVDKKFQTWIGNSNWQRNPDEPGQWYRSESALFGTFTVEIMAPASVVLQLESIRADMEVRGMQGEAQLKTISGFVDMDWPAQQGANLEMKTISGEVYSDLNDLTFSNKQANPMVGYSLKGQYGNGQTPLRLESISGDIYLRQKRQ